MIKRRKQGHCCSQSSDHPSKDAKREGDGFFNEGGLMTENSNEGGFLLIMNLNIVKLLSTTRF